MYKLLFVCIENSNRSQMAEGFARALGVGVLDPFSAGSRPSGTVNPRAVAAMKRAGIDISGQSSKGLDEVPAGPYGHVVTMGCGDACPWIEATHREDWDLPDPRDLPAEAFDAVRDRIRDRVVELVERVRGGR